ncbi:hypothetical protein HQQ94_09535 [Shewanella sp. VB17]|uniref:hypothetical protein n=1 Tax=Shewanella sp. VB17 TaxID=2739432 RepID=UPI0015664702|nr:hypothetical protein [Shewanella sp. VB17]NRD73482.1 hypothetical protein [Shewanella sp. VB17]
MSKMPRMRALLYLEVEGVKRWLVWVRSGVEIDVARAIEGMKCLHGAEGLYGDVADNVVGSGQK